MYKWKIKVFMKNKEIFNGSYEGPESNSGDVAKALITGDINTSWFGIRSNRGTSNLIIRLSEVSALDISLA